MIRQQETRVAVETKAESKAEDLALMRRIAERDPAALRELYDKHSGLIYTLALRVLNKPDDAEELVGDVFWEVWEKSSRYDQTRSSPLTYLVTLARSRGIDRTRRKGYRQNAKMQQWTKDRPPRTPRPTKTSAAASRPELCGRHWPVWTIITAKC
jgi:DNA-directed RNA polymerase specialized sigma24 family protein